jgi:cytochrome P450
MLITLVFISVLALISIWFYDAIQLYLLRQHYLSYSIKELPHSWKDYFSALSTLEYIWQHIKRLLNQRFSSLNVGRGKSEKHSNLNLLAHRVEQYGPIHFGLAKGELRVYLFDPMYLQYVLRNNQSSYGKGKVLKELAGRVFGHTNLLLADDPIHSQKRKIVSPCFHYHNLIEMAKTINTVAIQRFKEWEVECRNAPKQFQLDTELSNLSVEILLRCLMKFSSNEDFAAIRAKVYDNFIHIIELQQYRVNSNLSFIPILNRLPWFGEREISQKITQIHQTMDRLIQQRIELNGQISSKVTDTETLVNLDFLDFLVTREGFTREDVRDECLTFLLAGHGTTPMLITATLYLLSLDENQNQLNDLLNEIDAKVGEEENITHDLLQQCKVLDAIVQEGLRLYPAFPMIRECIQNNVIGPTDQQIQIKQGTIVIIQNYGLHRLHEHFPSPLVMDYTRWTSQNAKPWTYLPFGGGSRSCIGKNFALLQSKIVLIHFLRRFQMHLVEGQTIQSVLRLTLRFQSGIQVILSNIHNKL